MRERHAQVNPKPRQCDTNDRFNLQIGTACAVPDPEINPALTAAPKELLVLCS
jgi:hypothetical protein